LGIGGKVEKEKQFNFVYAASFLQKALTSGSIFSIFSIWNGKLD
jgi:hypothetical protein